MAKRTGLPTVRAAAAFLCAFIAAALPAIKKQFPDEDGLHNGLEVLMAACCAMVLLADEVIEVGD